MGEREWCDILEREFQKELIKTIKIRFSGAIVIKNDSSYIQGIPDLIILYNNKWAALEVKNSETASRQPNQEWYIDIMNNMSFAAFITPQNREDVLYDLERALRY